MSNLLTNTQELTSVANAIRTKGGTSSLLTYPQGFIDAIGAIPGPEPLPSDRKWTRPSNYPDLDSLNYPSDDSVIYATCDKAFAGTDTTVGGEDLTLTAGHIENGEFVADYEPVEDVYNLADINENIFVLKIVGLIDIIHKAKFLAASSHSIIEIYWSTIDKIHVVKMTNLENIKHCKIFNIPSNVTSMSSMFNNCHSLQSIEFGENFDTSNVTDMSNMFYDCYSLQSLDVSNFDTSNVTEMSSMFNNCYSLQSLDLSNFNTGNVTSMSSMFYQCYLLQSIDFGENFDTSKVTSMGSMFYGCYSLQTLDLSSFNTSNVTSMSSMFNNCYSLYILKSPTIGWHADVNFGTSKLFRFYATSAIDLFDKLPTITTTKTLKLDKALQYKLTDEDIAVAQNKGWTITFG